MSTSPSILPGEASPARFVPAAHAEDARRRHEIALAWAILVLGLGGCGWVLVSGAGQLWRWQVPVLVIYLLVAHWAAARLDSRTVASAWGLIAVVPMAFLGPAATFAIFALAEVCLWPVRRTRPFSALASLLGSAGTFTLGAIVLLAAKEAIGYHDDAFYIIVAAVTFLCDGLVTVSAAALRWLRWREDPMVDLPVRQLLIAASVAAPLAVAVAKVYAINPNRGLGMMVVMSVTYSVLLRNVVRSWHRSNENAALAASRAVLLADLLEAEDRERQHIAEALHDDAVQNLLAMGHDLEDVAAGRIERLARAQMLVSRTVEQLRGAMSELHPSVLEHAGLEVALTNVLVSHASRRGFHWRVEVDRGAVGVHDRLVFSLARELIANAAWHANAATVRVRVFADGGRVSLEVSDDGVGFDPVAVRATGRAGHLGLVSVAQRVSAAAGSVQIGSALGRGTTVIVTLPVAPEAIARVRTG